MLGQRLMILKGLQYGRPHNNFDVSAVMNPGFLHWSRGERGGLEAALSGTRTGVIHSFISIPMHLIFQEEGKRRAAVNWVDF